MGTWQHIPGRCFIAKETTNKKIEKHVKKVSILIIMLVVLAAGGAVWIGLPGTQKNELRMVTARVVRGDCVNKVQATGTLEPEELVDVGAQVTGEIKEFGTDVEGKRVDYGSEVKAGQLLARIDDALVELDIKRAEASVAQAKAQIISAKAAVKQAEASIAQATANKNKADRDLLRAQKLGVGDALSQMEFDQYVNTAESAAAALQSAEAQLHTARAQQANADASLQSAQAQLAIETRNRDYTRITTPVDGTIVVRQVNVGQTVVSNMSATTLFLVARDLSHMQIWASVNEADIAKVHQGQEVRYTVDALPNETFSGKVNKIRPNATMASNVVTYIVEVDIDNPDRKLLPYMSANANFIVEEAKDCLMVPDTAFEFHPPHSLIVPGQAESFAPLRKKEKANEGDEEGENGKAGASAEQHKALGDDALVIWKKAGKYAMPVRVRRGLGDGTRSVVVPLEGESLSEGDLIITDAIGNSGSAVKPAEGERNLFGMNRPQRRERSTGGAAPKPGQNANRKGRPGPPPM